MYTKRLIALFCVLFFFEKPSFSQDKIEPEPTENTMIFPGCKGDENQLKKCFIKNVQLHIANNFDVDLPNQLGLKPGKKRGYVMFTITKSGDISDIKVRAKHPDLAKECRKALSNFPKVIPRKIDGIAQMSEFSTPFDVYVKKPITVSNNLVENDIQPIYSGCETEKDLKKCFSLKIQKYLKQNIDKNALGLSLGDYQLDINFTITKDGNTIFESILNKSSKKNLNKNTIKEFREVILNLPKFSPAKRKEKPVKVVCTIPFKFQVTEVKTIKSFISGQFMSPLSPIDSYPTHPDCKGDKNELKNCLTEKLQNHFKANINRDLLATANGIININFVIKSNGIISSVVVIKEKGTLKNEILRIMNRLPKLVPGKQDGKPINVMYNLPITFATLEDKNESSTISIKEPIVSFAIIEDVPIFPGCKGNKRQLKECFSKRIQQHFANKFDADLPNRLGLSPGRKRVFIGFKINFEGIVTDIKVKAPHKEIKEEVISVMKKLPKMIPGKQAGKPVGVYYSIPFTMIVEGNKVDDDPFRKVRKSYEKY